MTIATANRRNADALRWLATGLGVVLPVARGATSRGSSEWPWALVTRPIAVQVSKHDRRDHTGKVHLTTSAQSQTP